MNPEVSPLAPSTEQGEGCTMPSSALHGPTRDLHMGTRFHTAVSDCSGLVCPHLVSALAPEVIGWLFP